MAGKGKTKQAVQAPPPSEGAPRVVSRDAVPEIYIDGFQGMTLRGGVAKLNLFSDVQVFLAKEGILRQIVARLTMSVPVLIAFHETLGRMISDMERDGAIKRVPEGGEAEK